MGMRQPDDYSDYDDRPGPFLLAIRLIFILWLLAMFLFVVGTKLRG